MTGPKASQASTSRREFLKTTTAAAAGTAALSLIPNAYARAGETIKVGLIGCGGRGRGAAEDICEAAGTSSNVKLHALADVFEDRVNDCYDFLKNNQNAKEKFDVDKERCFVGFDAFQKVTDCCDLVLLATPPGFRPQHLAYAVKAGKHIFTEKPVAVDGPGIRKVLAVAEEAQRKDLAIVVGTQRRHQDSYLEAMARIHDGDVGDPVAGRVFWNQGNIWAHRRQPGWSDMEYQIRNWYHFVWLCGDCIVEQHIHILDVACWALKGHPVRCVGMGGQEVNTAPEYGESFDHFSVDYEFPGGVHVLSMGRQIDGCKSDVSQHLVGTKGPGAAAAASGSRGRGGAAAIAAGITATLTCKSISTCSRASPAASRSTS
ncbi:MAG: Gfo/Idh/MocA family oxidoreductase [Planctomycetaceae bacterium]|nr:Gfo/Idh/MocA family oxidoreductase [Planctomycetaceae bacterium]